MSKDYISGKEALTGPPGTIDTLDQVALDFVSSVDADDEEHGLGLTYAPTLASGSGAVGVNMAVVPTGSAANWVSAFYGKVTQATKAVNGYLCGAEFEVVLSGTYGPSYWGVLVLNSSDSNTGAQPAVSAYVFLRDYGTREMPNLFYFADTTRAAASNSVIASAVGAVTGRSPYDTAIKFLIGGTAYWLMASSVGPATIADLKVPGATTNDYLEYDASANTLNVVATGITGSSEHNGVVVSVASAATYLTGDDITYSTAKGGAILQLVGTATMASGGFEGIDIKIASSGAFTAAGAGVLGLKCVVTNTAAITDGNMYGGQFIVKHTHDTNEMGASAALIGLEGIGYVAGDAPVGTMIGINAVIRSYGTSQVAGSVHRGIQIVIDEASNEAVEVTGLCIWNMGGGTVHTAIRLVGVTTMTAALYFDTAAGCIGTTELVDNAEADVDCDAHIVCDIGGTPYYIPLYNTKK